MRIEILMPLTVRLPEGELRLMPGQAVNLPDDRAQKLLSRAPGKVRLADRSGPSWLIAWRELAALTECIQAEDVRFTLVMIALNECDEAYMNGDWPAFLQAAARVRTVCGQARVDP